MFSLTILFMVFSIQGGILVLLEETTTGSMPELISLLIMSEKEST